MGPNPSPIGGTWAYCWVQRDLRIRKRSGAVTPEDLGVEAVTNNMTELLAAILALESVPAGWDGTLYTDSRVTACRLKSVQAGQNGTPIWMAERCRKLAGKYRIALLAGHPTELDLIRGIHREKRLPVSEHNVACDRMCTLAGKSLR